MPFICIGPVCIPWTAVVPIIVFVFQPIWVRLPEPWRVAFRSRYGAFQDTMQALVWDKIGWKAKPKKAPASADPLAPAPADGDKLLAQRGSVSGLHTDSEWKAALELTKTSGVPMIVDFTAVWCGPCQRIAPDFARLAKANPTMLFVKVDVDELEEVMQEAEVMAMPTFQVYSGGKKADTLEGDPPPKSVAYSPW